MSQSTADFLKQYLGGPSGASDYLEPEAKKKAKKKGAKRAPKSAESKKKKSSLQILDVDFEAKVDGPVDDDYHSADGAQAVSFCHSVVCCATAKSFQIVVTLSLYSFLGLSLFRMSIFVFTPLHALSTVQFFGSF